MTPLLQTPSLNASGIQINFPGLDLKATSNLLSVAIDGDTLRLECADMPTNGDGSVCTTIQDQYTMIAWKNDPDTQALYGACLKVLTDAFQDTVQHQSAGPFPVEYFRAQGVFFNKVVANTNQETGVVDYPTAISQQIDEFQLRELAGSLLGEQFRDAARACIKWNITRTGTASVRAGKISQVEQDIITNTADLVQANDALVAAQTADPVVAEDVTQAEQQIQVLQSEAAVLQAKLAYLQQISS